MKQTGRKTESLQDMARRLVTTEAALEEVEQKYEALAGPRAVLADAAAAELLGEPPPANLEEAKAAVEEGREVDTLLVGLPLRIAALVEGYRVLWVSDLMARAAAAAEEYRTIEAQHEELEERHRREREALPPLPSPYLAGLLKQQARSIQTINRGKLREVIRKRGQAALGADGPRDSQEGQVA